MPDSSVDTFITFQERVFLSYVLGPAKRIVNTTGFWKLTGPLNDDALRIALDAVTKRNISLRIYYDETSVMTPEAVERQSRYPGEPNYRRHVAPEVTPVLEIQMIEHLAPEAREEFVRAFGQDENKRPIDLMHAPLFTCSLLHAGDDLHYLALTLFHTLADGLALEPLCREISEAYNAALAGRAPDTTPKKPDLYDVLKWLRGKTRDPALKQQTIDYWSDYVKDFSDLRLRTDHEVGPDAPITYKALRAPLDFRLPVTLEAFEKEHGALAQGLAYAPYVMMLSTFAPGRTILSNNPMSGRFVPGYENVLGYWFAMRIAKAKIDPNMSALDFVRGLEKDYVAAQDHSVIDFNSILTALLSKGLLPADFFKRRVASHVMFNCLGTKPAPVFALKDVACEEISTSFGQTLPCHFNGEVRIDGDHITGVIACWEQHYSQATADRMATLYELILKAIMGNPRATLGEILKTV